MTKNKESVIKQKTIDVTIAKNINIQKTRTTQEEKMDLIEKQLNFIKVKLKQLNEKRWCSKQNQWGNLKSDLNQILQIIKLQEVKLVFERKFGQEIRLLYDFHMRRYQQPMFRVCFSCCPNWILRKLKYYKLIDDKFQVSVSSVQKTPRTIYFYVHLLYNQLFILLVTLLSEKDDTKNNNKFKSPDGKLQDRNQKKIIQKDIVQGSEKRYQLDQNVNQQKIQKLRTNITQIMANDWKDIINIEQWCSYSYRGYIQINTEAPIQTFLQFKDCKLKTSYLFQEISSSSFDLRTCLVRKSKYFSKSHQYVLSSLHTDSLEFKLRFWLADNQNTPQNHTTIQKYVLLAMRIGIKQKILRCANFQYKQKATHWIINNYVHISMKPHQHTQSQFGNNQSSADSSYQSVSENEPIDAEKFWWINYREALIRAIVQVSRQKMKSGRGSPQINKEIYNEKKGQIKKYLKKNPQVGQQIESNFNGQNVIDEEIKNKYKKESKFKQEQDKRKRVFKQKIQNQNMQSIGRLMRMDDFKQGHISNQI